jgi:hypothetical protein
MTKHPVLGFVLRRSLGMRRAMTAIAFSVAVRAAQSALSQLPDITVGQRPESGTGTESPLTMVPHLADGRFWISGQNNFI